MAETGMTLNSLSYMLAMDELVKEVPEHMATVVYWQMGLLTKDIIAKVGGNPTVGIEQYRTGMEKRIAADLGKLFGVLNDSDRISAPDDKGNAIVQRGRGKKAETFWILDSRRVPSFASVDRIHAGSRDSKGRVRKSGSWQERESYKGNTLNKQYFTSRTMLADYIKAIQSHVGRTKAAWCKAADYFGAKAAGFITSLYPSWVGRHKGWAAQYSVSEDVLNPHDMTGYVAAGSNVPWASDPDNLIESCLETRRKDIEKGYAKTRLEAILKAHSASGAAA